MENHYDSEEDLQAGFKRLNSIDLDSHLEKEEVEALLKECVKVQQSIQRQGVFSPNEELSDMDEEHLKFILLPYLMAQLFAKLQNNRLKQLTMSEQYYTVYMKLQLDYQQLGPIVKKQWDELTTKEDYQISRDNKVNNYRRQSQLKEEVKHRLTQDDKRQYYTSLFELYQYDALSQVQFSKEERKMLNFRIQLEQDVNVKEAYEKRQKNIPKLSSVTIPKEDAVNRIDSAQIQQEQNIQQGYECGECMKFGNRDVVGMNDQMIKQELKERVFQPGHSVPTMRLNDFADQEIAKMERDEEITKRNKEEAERNKVDSDNEDYLDAKQMEARRWDDWKDDNEKGAGNKHK